MDYISLVASILYFVVFAISFKSFLIKEDFRFHTSLHLSYAFFLWGAVAFFKAIGVPEIIKDMFIFLEMGASFLLFGAITKIKSATTKNPNLNFRKFVNVLYLLLITASTLTLGYSLMLHNFLIDGNPYIYALYVNKYIITLVLYFLITIHLLPTITEMKRMRIAMGFFSVKYVIKLIGLLVTFPDYIYLGSEIFSITGLLIAFKSLYSLYTKSIKNEKEKQLN